MLGSSHRLAITLNKALNPCEPQVPCVNGNNEQVVKTAKWVKIGTGMPLKSHLLQLLQLVTSSVNWIHERNGFIFQISLGALRKNLVHLKLKAYWPVKSINVSNDGENEHTYIQLAENKNKNKLTKTLNGNQPITGWTDESHYELRLEFPRCLLKGRLRSNLKAKRRRSRPPGPHGQSLRVYLLHTWYMETTNKSSLKND